ncbi:sugar ABC transporter substrate-binding protein [Microbacterium sp. NPDC057650]|uniref:ABC transporter substrate-binding protein n=1 Tax=unclassified Microbacterium TaxID=2609290 RepID=UPI00366E8357
MSPTRTRLAAVAGLAVAAVVLSACSGGEAPKTDSAGSATIAAEQSVGAMDDFAAGTTFKATKPTTFSLMYRDHPNYPVQDDWSIFTNLKANQNVSFKRTDIPLADFDKKKALLIGGGEATDIISVTYPGQETQFVAGGAILPVSEYFQYMPNFQKKIKDWDLQDELDTHRQEDGKIYMLPGLREVPDVQYSVMINEAMWDKAGITEDPKTYDELAEDLAKVKQANPDISYALSDRWTDQTPLGAFLNVAAPSYGTQAGWGYANPLWDADAGKFVFNATGDGYKGLMQYASGLVKDGVLDPEITQSDDAAAQKFISGKSAAISGNTQALAEYRGKLADAGRNDVKIRLLNVPGGPAGDNLAYGRFTSGLMIGSEAAKQPYFKALLQYIDWQYYSDEGLEFALWGVDGETYSKASDGTRTLNSDVNWSSINPDAPKKLNADFGYSNGVFSLANGSSADLTQSMMTPEIKDWTKAQIDTHKQVPVPPAASLSEAELEQTSLQQTQLTDAVKTATAAFITGQKSIDKDWDAYVTQLKTLGSDQLIDTINGALKKSK